MSVRPIPRVDVLGIEISAVDMGAALVEITRWVERRERHYVCVTGVHGVMESVRDPELLRIHNASGLTTPDGMPMVWCAHWAGARHVRRVSGPDLMLALSAEAAGRGWTSYFYGGSGSDGSRGRIRHQRRSDQARSSMDATFWSGVAFPPWHRAAPSVASLSPKQPCLRGAITVPTPSLAGDWSH